VNSLNALFYHPDLTNAAILLALELGLLSVVGWLVIRLLKPAAPPFRSLVCGGLLISLVGVAMLFPVFRAVGWGWKLPTISESSLIPLLTARAHGSKSPIDDARSSSKTPPLLNSSKADSDLTESSKPVMNGDAPDRLAEENQFLPAAMAVLSGVWLLGALVLFGRLACDLIFLRGFTHGLRSVEDERFQEILTDVSRRFRLKKPPQLFASPVVESPITTGWCCPKIILPERLLSSITEEEIRGVVFHEMAHILHRDNLMGLIQRVAVAFNWWNPLVYRLSTAFSAAREEVSDTYAILAMCEPTSYARCLVSLAEKISLVNTLPATSGMAGDRFDLRQRIQTILQTGRPMLTRTSRIERVLIVGTFAALTLIISITNGTEVRGEDGLPLAQQPFVTKEEGSDKNAASKSENFAKRVETAFKLSCAKAQTGLGSAYFNGQGVTKNETEAVKWYRMAAEQGYAPGQHGVGLCYARGRGVPEDDEEAVKWYRKAAEQGFAQAQADLGYRYATGIGVTEDPVEAVEWYRKAVKQGNPQAQNNLGSCYIKGSGVPKDETEAVKWYRKAAEQEWALAQDNLGRCYNKGSGVAKDPVEAVKWFLKAAEQGNARAQGDLAWAYDKGEGVTKDPVEAVKWYRKSAEQGNLDAQFNLGCSYADGEGIAKDPVEAVKWFLKAAEQEKVSALVRLGHCYQSGTGVSKDETEAVKWYRKAAEQEDVHGLYSLGYCYANGIGLSKDDEEAVKCYRKAAEQGYAMAQYALGSRYEEGQGGLTKNESEAVQWYQKAAAQGYANAQKKLQAMESKQN